MHPHAGFARPGGPLLFGRLNIRSVIPGLIRPGWTAVYIAPQASCQIPENCKAQRLVGVIDHLTTVHAV